ncbi:hypothetical protein SDC9_09182 [bioreactor metagenome]|uniref:Uncharacterized protein n=1 Tax=bioreactor metagenome TaxID=1076179 RepID=A0A644TBH9_9ZZZZ
MLYSVMGTVAVNSAAEAKVDKVGKRESGSETALPFVMPKRPHSLAVQPFSYVVI